MGQAFYDYRLPGDAAAALPGLGFGCRPLPWRRDRVLDACACMVKTQLQTWLRDTAREVTHDPSLPVNQACSCTCGEDMKHACCEYFRLATAAATAAAVPTAAGAVRRRQLHQSPTAVTSPGCPHYLQPNLSSEFGTASGLSVTVLGSAAPGLQLGLGLEGSTEMRLAGTQSSG